MRKYVLPQDRMPRPFRQNIIDQNGKLRTEVKSCVACTFVGILEVYISVLTGKSVELSRGYFYGRNNYPDKKGPGMVEEYTLDIMLERTTVPFSMCSDYTEFPDIAKILESRPDIAELDNEAEKIKLKAWKNISGNNPKQLFENVKTYLRKYKMPLAGTIRKYEGEKHNVIIVDYDDDGYIYFHNHKGSHKLERVKYDRFGKAYYLDVCVEGLTVDNEEKEANNMALKPVTEINDIVWELANAGIITDSNLWIHKCKEDVNVYWLCRKMANKLRGTL